MLASIVLLYSTNIQAQNPYESLGVEVDVLTLSKGKYKEFHPNDTIVQIGTVLFNTITGEVVAFVDVDTVYSEATLKPEIVSRWMSPDPLTDEFPSWAPQNLQLSRQQLHAVRIQLQQNKQQNSERPQRGAAVAEEGQRNADHRKQADGHANVDGEMKEQDRGY